MATYNPPTENLPIFDDSVFQHNNQPLTIAYANNHYLQYPTAQGTENLLDINVAGDATFSNPITTHSNIILDTAGRHIEYPDLTIQESAYTGGTAGTYTSTNITLDANGKISAISSGNPIPSSIVVSSTNTSSPLYPVLTNASGSSQSLSIDTTAPAMTFVPSTGTLSTAILNANTSVNYPDSTVQTSAFTGAGLLSGSYTNTNITVNNQGKITALANGSSSGSSNATTVDITTTDSASILYPILAGVGTTQTLYADNITTPLSYVPFTGLLSTKTMTTTNDINVNGVKIGSNGLVQTTILGAGNAGNTSVSTGGYNTMIGNASGSSMTTGIVNTLIGQNSGSSITTAINNTTIGASCGSNITTGGYNTMIGSQSGNNITGTSGNTCIGYNANVGTGLSTSTAIGYNASCTASNTIQLGRSTDNVNCPNTLSVTGIITATGGLSGNSSTATSAGTCTGNSATATNISSGNAGDLLYQSGASATAKLPIGASTYVLTSNGSIPQWTAPAVITTPTLANVLLASNSAGSTSINMNNQSITNPSDITFASTVNIPSSSNQCNVDIGYNNLTNASLANNNTNIAIGSSIMNGVMTSAAQGNIAFGQQSLQSVTSGNNNLAIGQLTLTGITTGTNNVGIGYQVGQSVSTSSGNTIIGGQAGSFVTNQSNNTCIGKSANVSSTAIANATAIGYNSIATASNQVRIGTSANTVSIPASTTTFDNAITQTNSASAITLAGQLTANNLITANSNLTIGNSNPVINSTSGTNPLQLQGGGGQGVNIIVDNSAFTTTFNANGNVTFPNTVNATTFVGALSGNASSATTTSTITTTSDNTLGSYYIPFTKTSAGASKTLYIDDTITPFTYNPSTSKLAINDMYLWKGLFPADNSFSIGNNTTLTTITASGLARDNIGIGNNTLMNITTGSGNCCFGSTTGNSITTGASNACIGGGAGAGNTTGSNNTFCGSFSGTSSVMTSDNNTCVGYLTGATNTIGFNNTYLGASADANANNYSNSTAVGTGAIITASNQIVLGRSTETLVVPNSSLTITNATPSITTTGTGNLNLSTLIGTGGNVVLASRGTTGITVQPATIINALSTQFQNAITLSNSTPSILTIGTGSLSINTPVTTGGNVVIGSQTISNITATPTNITFGTATNYQGNNMTGAGVIQAYTATDIVLRTPAASTNSIKISPLSVDALVVSSAGVATFTNSPILPITAPTNTANQLGYIQTKVSSLTGSITSGTYQSLVSGGFSLTAGIYSLQIYIQNTITAVAGSVTSMLVGLSTSNTAFVGGSNNYAMGCTSIPAVAGFIVGNYHTVFIVTATTTYYIGETLVYTSIVPTHSAAGTSYVQITRIG